MLDVYYSRAAFVRWLRRELGARVGWGTDANKISKAAGLHENALGQLVRGERKPSEHTCELLSTYLHIPLEVFRRRGGVDPIIANGKLVGTMWEPGELEGVLRVVREALETQQGGEIAPAP